MIIFCLSRLPVRHSLHTNGLKFQRHNLRLTPATHRNAILSSSSQVSSISFSSYTSPSTSSSSSFSSSSYSSLFSTSSFVPPEPPAFNGQPVYPDIDLSTTMSSNEGMKRNEDPNSIFVVTGASRGIGLQMVKTLSKRTKGTIIACCRTPSKANDLKTFLQQNNDINSQIIDIQQLDLEDQSSIEHFSKTIQEKYNRVDVLFNVAGILGDGNTTPGPERSIRSLDREWVSKTFAVNYMGPLFLSQALAPMMRSKSGITSVRKKENGNHQTEKKTQERASSVIANLSARVGSISDNGLGGWISYRSSKAALNQATRTMSLELKRQGTWTISLHPGTTNTDLSKPFQRNVKEGRLFPVEFTVGQLLSVVDNMDERHSGGFYDWSGTALPF